MNYLHKVSLIPKGLFSPTRYVRPSYSPVSYSLINCPKNWIWEVAFFNLSRLPLALFYASEIRFLLLPFSRNNIWLYTSFKCSLAKLLSIVLLFGISACCRNSGLKNRFILKLSAHNCQGDCLVDCLIMHRMILKYLLSYGKIYLPHSD